jgi:ribosomal subunit interface protein
MQKEPSMQISFSSKTVQLTDEVKLFVQRKLQRLNRFASLHIDQFQVVVDRVKRGGKNTSEAQVEVVAEVQGKHFAFKEVGANLYQALYKTFNKVEKKLGRESHLHER